LVRLLTDLDFRERNGRGSHRIFIRVGVIEIVNLQMENGDPSRFSHCGFFEFSQ
jgi:hypothetical protein